MPNPLQSSRRLAVFLLALTAGAVALLLWQRPAASPWAVDPDSVELAWRPATPLHRLVRELPPDDDARALAQFRAAVGTAFAADYTEDILAIGPADDPGTAAEVRTFATHESIAGSLAAIDTTSGTAAGLDAAEHTIEDAFRRFHAHFPTTDIPHLVFMHSGFNYAVYPTDSTLAVGLEWFLGPDHPIVESLAPSAFPAYLRARMMPNRLAAEAVRGWLLVHFSRQWYQPQNCADALLFWGKVLFVVDQILPDTPDPTWMDWTAEEWSWAAGHEREVWLEMSQQDVLFNTNPMEFSRWFNEGPFTRAAAIPQDSPDRLGAYIGYRIVSDYMNENKDLTLSGLMAMTDPMPFLQTYRPK
jgi:hypothetical protein